MKDVYWLTWVEINPTTDYAINEWGKPFKTLKDALDCATALQKEVYVGKILVINPDDETVYTWSKPSLEKANWNWLKDYE